MPETGLWGNKFQPEWWLLGVPRAAASPSAHCSQASSPGSNSSSVRDGHRHSVGNREVLGAGGRWGSSGVVACSGVPAPHPPWAAPARCTPRAGQRGRGSVADGTLGWRGPWLKIKTGSFAIFTLGAGGAPACLVCGECWEMVTLAWRDPAGLAPAGARGPGHPPGASEDAAGRKQVRKQKEGRSRHSELYRLPMHNKTFYLKTMHSIP